MLKCGNVLMTRYLSHLMHVIVYILTTEPYVTNRNKVEWWEGGATRVRIRLRLFDIYLSSVCLKQSMPMCWSVEDSRPNYAKPEVEIRLPQCIRARLQPHLALSTRLMAPSAP